MRRARSKWDILAGSRPFCRKNDGAVGVEAGSTIDGFLGLCGAGLAQSEICKPKNWRSTIYEITLEN